MSARTKVKRIICSALLMLAAQACSGESADTSSPAITADSSTPGDPAKLLIIGQDLGAIRGYMASDCCPRPDGLTAYLDFYDILKEGDFGGLGIDPNGDNPGFEFSWGAGPVGAYQTATEFGVDGLAIGLSITENEHPGGLGQLVDGDFDAEIRQLARFGSMIEGPIYLRIGYEFDGAWNRGYEDADQYVAAYRRIVSILREQGTENFEFVWQSGTAVVDDIIDGGHEDIRKWYPGDEYVDWMAFSWFMNPDETVQVSPSYQPPTPLELTEELLGFARERGKPVMIAEASPQAMDLNENFMANHSPIWDGESASNPVRMSDEQIWEHWFGPLFELLNDNKDVVHALAYINADWDSQEMWGPPYESGFWGDTRLETNAAIAKRFAKEIEIWKAQQ
jgi:hypothetical protein